MARANVERIDAMLVERPARAFSPELARRVGLEEMRAAVDGVHRLALAGVAGEAAHERDERGVRAASASVV